VVAITITIYMIDRKIRFCRAGHKRFRGRPVRRQERRGPRGSVIAVYTSKKVNTFLNFGAKYLNQTFTGYIPAGSELSGDRWILTLQGKVIGITGTIELY
jgi:hypothetical protein